MQGVWRGGETEGEIAMFKKIAQWMRTRQERRLRYQVLWGLIGKDGTIKRADEISRFILYGDLPENQETSD